MTSPEVVAESAILFGLIGVVASFSLLTYGVVISFKDRLKEDVSTKDKLRAFPKFAKWFLENNVDWRTFIRAAAIVTGGAFLVGAFLSIFLTGLYVIFL